MTEILQLDRAVIQYAIDNPYVGNSNAENAAYGRAAEPVLVERAALDLYPAFISSVSEKKHALSPEVAKVLGREKRHDGLIFSGDEFIGVIEVKLAIKPFFYLPQHEYDIYSYCRDNGFIYAIIVGELTNRDDAQIEYKGVIDVGWLEQTYPGLITTENKWGETFYRFQLRELAGKFVTLSN